VVFDGDPPRCPVDLDWEGRRPLLLLPADAEAAGEAHAARGFTVLPVPRGADGHLDLGQALGALWREGVAALLVEGGGRLLSAFLAAGLWERFELFVAPRCLPVDGRPFWTGAAPLAGLRFAAARERGEDVQLTLRPAPAAAPAT
jgi:diaminohydroxyphosphoribosylaminopyrimidine deaminase/5-amino-6-(5-phosphoribosylamino)uracil reductase